MSLTQAEVEHIADLARLDLSEEELARFREQMSDVLEYAARLQKLDTRAILPTANVFATRAVLREDVAVQSLKVEQVLSNAPQAEDNQFRVPSVLE